MDINTSAEDDQEDQFFKKLAVKVDYEIELDKEKAPALILYSYRWIVLLSFFLTSAATGVM